MTRGERKRGKRKGEERAGERRGEGRGEKGSNLITFSNSGILCNVSFVFFLKDCRLYPEATGHGNLMAGTFHKSK